MPRQLGLIREPPAKLQVGPGREVPSVWVSRLVIWGQPGEVVRDIPLHRGVNIVYSPDPGTGLMTGRTESTRVGHCAGKTLLCRLLRYCLGESTFATADLMDRVGMRMPDAYVGADIHVGGIRWSVARPLGGRRREFAIREGELNDIFGSQGTSLQPLLDALDVAVIAPVRKAASVRHDLTWLHVLAWLARDQECRLAAPLDWRSSSAESGSPVLGLPREILAYFVRVLLGLMSGAENSSQQRHAKLLDEKRQKENKAKQLRAEILRLNARIRGEERLGDASRSELTELEASVLVAKASERVRALTEKLAALDSSEAAMTLEVSRDRLVGEVHALTVKADGLRAETRVYETQQKQLEADFTALDADRLMAKLGPLCPVCDVRIDQVLAKGCNLAAANNGREALEQRRNRLERDQAALVGMLERQKKQLLELEPLVERKTEELSEISKRISSERHRLVEERRHLLKELTTAQRDLWAAERLDETIREMEAAAQEAKQLEGEVRESRQVTQDLRTRDSDAKRRFNEFLQYVVEYILGPDALARPKFDLQDVAVDIDYDGQLSSVAMDGMKTWAFDVASLLSAIAGHSFLPAFLIHDGPREGDLGISLYYRYFQFLAELSGLTSEPPFQYIITTTTPPPNGLNTIREPVVVLDGTRGSERLLRRAL